MAIRVTCVMNADHVGGAELSTLEVLSSLSSEVEFCIVSQLEPPPELKRKFHFVMLRRVYFAKRFIDVVKLASNVIRNSIAIVRIVRANRSELIYAHSIQSFLYCILPKLILRKKLVWHVRDRAPSRLIYKIAYALSDVVICVSRFIYDSLPGKTCKKRLIVNGIDDDRWRWRRSFKIHDELGFDRATRIVANIGQLVPWKNQQIFITIARELLKKHPEVRFVIIGADPLGRNSQYVQSLKDRIVAQDLDRYIFLIGHKPYIEAYFNSIDILVHTAINEPFGRVTIEAMALGRPVVALSSGGPKEIILNGKTGYLFGSNELKIGSEKISALLTDKKLFTRIGKEARRHVSKSYTLTAKSSELEKLFHETCGK